MAKILIISWNFPPTVGGIENLMWEIYQNLSKGHRVKVITAGDPSLESDPNVTRLRSPNVLVFTVKAFFAGLWMAIVERPDVILAGSLLMNPVTVLIGLMTGAVRITMSYGLDIIYSNPLYQAYYRSTLRFNRFVVAISENSRLLLLEKGVPDKRIQIICPGVSQKFVGALANAPDPAIIRAKFGIGGRPCLVSVGRLTRRKGIHPFVRDCLPRILESVPDCVLVIVGEDPGRALVHREGESALINRAIDDLGLADKVIFTGKVDDRDLMGIYRAGDLFIFPVVQVPNDVEGFGMVAVEAALAGRPSVASRIGGIPDAVEDGVSGILVEPSDYTAFAEAVVRLLRDDRARLALGQSASERVRSRFTWDVLLGEWEGMLEKALSVADR